jgi:hypothetical protein
MKGATRDHHRRRRRPQTRQEHGREFIQSREAHARCSCSTPPRGRVADPLPATPGSRLLILLGIVAVATAWQQRRAPAPVRRCSPGLPVISATDGAGRCGDDDIRRAPVPATPDDRPPGKGSPRSNVCSPPRTRAGPSRWPRQGCRAGTPNHEDHDLGGSGTGAVPLVVVRFQSPPVKPCVRFSRTRLTDVVYRRHSARQSRKGLGGITAPSRLIRPRWSGERSTWRMPQSQDLRRLPVLDSSNATRLRA